MGSTPPDPSPETHERRPRSRQVPILENQPIARDTYRLRLGDPEMAATIQPGQFVMIRPGPEGSNDPLLGRPLALYDVVRDPAGAAVALDIVYLVVGRGTTALSRRRSGERVSVWGPLGNGFGPPPAGPVIFVAGGIGQTPFLALGRSWLGPVPSVEPPRSPETTTDPAQLAQHGETELLMTHPTITMLYGVRSAAFLAGVEDFRRAGIDVEVATDDGSAGHHGFVTELLARRLERGERPAKVVGCGPPAMLAALSRLVQSHGVACDVSLENHMACGFGACFSCVAPIRQADGSTDLRRVCIEGPVVAADLVDWSCALRSASRLRLVPDPVAEPGGLLVILVRDGFVELLPQRLLHREVLADLLFDAAECIDQRGVRGFGRVVFVPPVPLMGRQPIDPIAQGVDRFIRPLTLQRQGRRGLGPMEQDRPAKLLVRGDVFVLESVPVDEVHQGERVVRVQNGLIVAPKGQPGDATMIELDEFAVRLRALVRRHHPRRRLAARRLPSSRRAMTQVIEVRREAMRPRTIGTSTDLELKHSQLDPDLQDPAAVASADLTREDFPGLGVIRPSLDHVIQVASHHCPPPRSVPSHCTAPRLTYVETARNGPRLHRFFTVRPHEPPEFLVPPECARGRPRRSLGLYQFDSLESYGSACGGSTESPTCLTHATSTGRTAKRGDMNGWSASLGSGSRPDGNRTAGREPVSDPCETDLDRTRAFNGWATHTMTAHFRRPDGPREPSPG